MIIKAKKKKLWNFENWSQWADFIQTILEEKNVQDIIDGSQAEPIIAAQTRKKKKIIQLPLRSSDKQSTWIFLLILLEKKTPRGYRKYFVISTCKLGKKQFT